MIWPFGQIIIFTDFGRSFGGAGRSAVDTATRLSPGPVFALPMECASQLIFSGCNNSFGLIRQHVLWPHAT